MSRMQSITFQYFVFCGGVGGLSVFYARGEVGERELAACAAASVGMRVERAVLGAGI